MPAAIKYHTQISVRHHCFGDKAGGERKGRDRKTTDDAANSGQRHAARQSAVFGELALAGHQKDRADGHNEQRFINNVRERVRHRAVQREFGADTDTGDHESHLIDDAVAQHLASIVLAKPVNDPVKDHEQADKN